MSRKSDYRVGYHFHPRGGGGGGVVGEGSGQGNGEWRQEHYEEGQSRTEKTRPTGGRGGRGRGWRQEQVEEVKNKMEQNRPRREGSGQEMGREWRETQWEEVENRKEVSKPGGEGRGGGGTGQGMDKEWREKQWEEMPKPKGEGRGGRGAGQGRGRGWRQEHCKEVQTRRDESRRGRRGRGGQSRGRGWREEMNEEEPIRKEMSEPRGGGRVGEAGGQGRGRVWRQEQHDEGQIKTEEFRPRGGGGRGGDGHGMGSEWREEECEEVQSWQEASEPRGEGRGGGGGGRGRGGGWRQEHYEEGHSRIEESRPRGGGGRGRGLGWRHKQVEEVQSRAGDSRTRGGGSRGGEGGQGMGWDWRQGEDKWEEELIRREEPEPSREGRGGREGGGGRQGRGKEWRQEHFEEGQNRTEDSRPGRGGDGQGRGREWRQEQCEEEPISEEVSEPRGSCMTMCPLREVREREAQRRLHRFEVLPGTERDRLPKADPSRAVKEYSRPAAGKDSTRPSDLRPPAVLLKTVCFLIDDIAAAPSQEPWTEVYDFVFDRLRCVRQDMVIQRVSGTEAAAVLERIVRFLLYASYRLCEEPLRLYDPRINDTHLQESLSWLLHCYSSGENQHRHQEEFQALNLLYNLGSARALQRALELPERVRSSPSVCRALAVNRAHLECNPVRVLRLARRLDFLQSCALHRHLAATRRDLLLLYSHGHSSRNCRYPLGRLAGLLALEPAPAARLCAAHGLLVDGDSVVFSKTAFAEPAPGDVRGERSHELVDGKQGDASLSAVIHGCV